MCGFNKTPRYKESVNELKLAQIWLPWTTDVRTMQPAEGHLMNHVMPCLRREPEPSPRLTREELSAKARLASQRNRNNFEAGNKTSPASYPGNFKQPWKYPVKDFGRNKNKDKRAQNYAFSRRE